MGDVVRREGWKSAKSRKQVCRIVYVNRDSRGYNEAERFWGQES